jgi:uncharacterized protein (TIGR00730 family)
MNYITVFCSASELEEKYVKPGKEFGRLLAEHGYTLVWGGSDRGLMKVVASSAQDAGGDVVGISVEHFKQFARKNATEMVVTKDNSERKRVMIERSDAIAILIGGVGTLDEATDIIALKKIDLYTKPVVIINTNNFYEGLKVQLQKMRDDGFISKPLDEILYFADTPEEAIIYLDTQLR